MKKMKRLLTATLAVFALAAGMVSASADEVIAPQTSVADSIIGSLNIDTNIFDWHWGNGESGDGTTVLMPSTTITDTNAAVVNVINNVVNISVNPDLSDISTIVTDCQNAIISKMAGN